MYTRRKMYHCGTSGQRRAPVSPAVDIADRYLITLIPTSNGTDMALPRPR